MVASGGDIDTVIGSSLPKLFSPHSFAAAICSATACTETFTAGTAMRSESFRSAIDLMLSERVLSRNGCAESAEMPRTSFGVPLVRFHSVSSPGTPPATTSIESEISALFIASGPLKVDHAIFTSFRPSAAACFSRSLSCSITLNCR